MCGARARLFGHRTAVRTAHITRRCRGPSRRVSFLWFGSRRGAGSATDRPYVMPRLRRHIFASVAWVLASLLVWVAVLNGLMAALARLHVVELQPNGRLTGPWVDVVMIVYLVVAVPARWPSRSWWASWRGARDSLGLVRGLPPGGASLFKVVVTRHNPPLERTAAAVYSTCGRASRVRRRGAATG